MAAEQTAADIVLTSVGRTDGSTSYAASMLWIAPRSFQECKRICGCFCSNTGRPSIERKKDRSPPISPAFRDFRHLRYQG